MSYSNLCRRLVLLVATVPPASCTLGSDVLTVALAYPDGGGYNWTPGNSGTPIGIEFAGEPILARGNGIICCGFTLAVAFEVAAQRGLLDGKHVEDVRAFQRHWYGETDASKETLCVYAVEKLGIGKAVDLEDAQPGDFVQFWRTRGSGHSVVLLDCVHDADTIVGLKYRSSQKSTNGISDRVEFLANSPGRKGKIVKSRTYVCRLNEATSRIAALPQQHIADLAADGEFAEAEKLLMAKITNPAAPVTSSDAIQLELLHRIRRDFQLSTEQVLEQIHESAPDATVEDVNRWRDAGDLQHRVIDGEICYFRRAVSNLFRFNPQARQRRQRQPEADKFDLTAHIAELVLISQTAEGPEVFPVKHNIHYELTVKEDHPRLRPGALFRAWLPFPQEYQQQRDVRLIRSEPESGIIAKNGRPHRTIYFEQTIAESGKPPRCAVEFEFVTSAWCPKLDPAAAEPYDTSSELYRKYTAERLPHIVLTPDVTRLAREIISEEENPLEKARRIFRWVSSNVSWCAGDGIQHHPQSFRKGACHASGRLWRAELSVHHVVPSLRCAGPLAERLADATEPLEYARLVGVLCGPLGLAAGRCFARHSRAFRPARSRLFVRTHGPLPVDR